MEFFGPKKLVWGGNWTYGNHKDDFRVSGTYKCKYHSGSRFEEQIELTWQGNGEEPQTVRYKNAAKRVNDIKLELIQSQS